MNSKRSRKFLTRKRVLTLLPVLFVAAVLIHQLYFARQAQAVPSTSIVISQIYGAGGNSGATFQNDYIELFNKGTSSVNLSGWSVQYASATGTGNFAANTPTLLSGTLAPGQYYLVREGGGVNGAPLPTADATGTIAMAAGAGKVIVANTTTGLACNGGSTPCNAAQLAQIVDLVGYGTGASGANFFEGASQAPTINATTADFRDDLGCVDTDQNGADFSSAVPPLSPTTPAPRNTASPLSPCVGPPVLTINDVTVTEGDSGPVTASFTVSLSSNVHTGVTFTISTADGTGPSPATTADNDYVAKTLTGQSIPSGQQSYTFDVTVNGDINFESNETYFVNVTSVSGATLADGQGVGTITNDDCPLPGGDVVISQVYGGGGNAGAQYQNDFIELFNQGTTTVNLSGWSVQWTSATGTGPWQVTPLSGSIAPGGYYLIQEGAGNSCSGSPCGVPLPAPDAMGTIPMGSTSGKVALMSSTAAISGTCPTCAIDLVGYGGANCFEGSAPTASTSNTTAALRKRSGCFDSNNNDVDFSVGGPNPRNSASPTNSCQPMSLEIHDIQGDGATTPYPGQFVSTTGIVTALKSNGFFMQEPDTNHDIYPETSEGIFVFTSAAPAVAVGNSVAVLGTATEFFNLTQLESSLPGDVTVIVPVNPAPLPVTLTTLILNPAGPIDQLERFEGMRMHADTVVSVAPSNEFGEIYTVLDGVARPLREPGIEVGLPVPPDPTGPPDCCIPIWDKNPERIMIDSDGLVGSSAISVTSNVTLSNITGPLDYTFGNYKIDPETPPTTSANMSAVPVPTPVANEFTVAGFNIENFNNGTPQKQKAALAIRDVLHLPDVIGHAEIFELSGLQALADEIEAISGVHYEARLIEADGNSGDADQDVGFLIKTSRVQIDSVTQEELAGCNGTAANCNTYIDPTSGNPALLNDRPPLVLRATVDPASIDPQPVIIVVNHLRSFIDIEGVSAEGERVRAKRKAQAEFLADLLQDLQTSNPTTPVISVGDYNAYQFNDGYTDPIATIKGMPTADDQVVVDESPDLVNPNFVNLIDGLPADQRYSFVFDGTPQALDHVLINTVANSYLTRFAIARNNADFPEVPSALFASNAARPERNSDHDMPIAYFLFPPDQDNDGIPDATDNCLLTANPDQANNDGDILGDACDPDDDNDGVPDVSDNCPFVANADQADADLDDIGDACDAQIGPPTNKDQCKNGGWQLFNYPRTFKNQGDCIQYVNTGK